MSEKKLFKIRNIAKDNKIEGIILPSTRKEKKYMLKRDGYPTIHFGAKNYEDWHDHQDKKRRLNYIKRHKGLKNERGIPYMDIPYTASYLSAVLLWNV